MATEYSGVEQYVAKCLDENDASWLPSGLASSLEKLEAPDDDNGHDDDEDDDDGNSVPTESGTGLGDDKFHHHFKRLEDKIAKVAGQMTKISSQMQQQQQRQQERDADEEVAELRALSKTGGGGGRNEAQAAARFRRRMSGTG